MYLLYLDESGTHPSARHFVLAGVAAHESSVYWVKEQLDGLQAAYFASNDDAPIMFHAAPLRTKSADRVDAPFDELDGQTRGRLLDELYRICNEMRGVFFAVVIEKAYLDESQDPYERALEEILSRFDHFIGRMYRERGERDRGLSVIADSSYRERLELFAHRLVTKGTRWGELRAIADIPFFTLSRNSRMLQMADLIANTVYGRYEKGLAARFDPMIPKFDQDAGAIHGLVHLSRNRGICYMPCCLPRRVHSAGSSS